MGRQRFAQCHPSRRHRAVSLNRGNNERLLLQLRMQWRWSLTMGSLHGWILITKLYIIFSHASLSTIQTFFGVFIYAPRDWSILKDDSKTSNVSKKESSSRLGKRSNALTTSNIASKVTNCHSLLFLPYWSFFEEYFWVDICFVSFWFFTSRTPNVLDGNILSSAFGKSYNCICCFKVPRTAPPEETSVAAVSESKDAGKKGKSDFTENVSEPMNTVLDVSATIPRDLSHFPRELTVKEVNILTLVYLFLYFAILYWCILLVWYKESFCLFFFLFTLLSLFVTLYYTLWKSNFL